MMHSSVLLVVLVSDVVVSSECWIVVVTWQELFAAPLLHAIQDDTVLQKHYNCLIRKMILLLIQSVEYLVTIDFFWLCMIVWQLDLWWMLFNLSSAYVCLNFSKTWWMDRQFQLLILCCFTTDKYPQKREKEKLKSWTFYLSRQVQKLDTTLNRYSRLVAVQMSAVCCFKYELIHNFNELIGYCMFAIMQRFSVTNKKFSDDAEIYG